MGIGLALIGRSLHRDEWIVLGLCGALLHVWNHALFKALLFLSAGSVIHATHTREIDHLGGLGRKMPWTAGLFLIGAVAICGLPPLNGFISEFFLYLGFFSTVRETVAPVYGAAAFAAPILALIGALAVACFVKVFTTIFLGTPRSTHSDHASESKLAIIAPMVVLAACCLIIGLAPQGLPLILDRSVRAWAPEIGERLPLLSDVAPLSSIGHGCGVACRCNLAGQRRVWHSPTSYHSDCDNHLGLRIRTAFAADAIYVFVVRSNARRIIREGSAANY